MCILPFQTILESELQEITNKSCETSQIRNLENKNFKLKSTISNLEAIISKERTKIQKIRNEKAEKSVQITRLRIEIDYTLKINKQPRPKQNIGLHNATITDTLSNAFQIYFS